jgi:hypothetical protein
VRRRGLFTTLVILPRSDRRSETGADTRDDDPTDASADPGRAASD